MKSCRQIALTALCALSMAARIAATQAAPLTERGRGPVAAQKAPPTLNDGVARTASPWRAVEIAFTSAHPYAAPFDDLTVDVTFTSPNHAPITRPAFWDGGMTWKVRFAAPTTGDWAYVTSCSDAGNAGLKGQRGVVHAVAYRGTLPIYRHGFLRPSDNHRYFTYADGTPFFYLGDTHWFAMHERFTSSNVPGVASQFKYEVDKRIAQGFTVYQSEWMAPHTSGHTGADEEKFYNWADGITEADLPGFRNIDRKFQYLADHGMIVANALNWHAYIPKLPDDYLRRLGRYWAARYGAYPVLWTMGQEVDGRYPDDPPELDAKWQVLAQALSENDAYHQPLTAHMCNSSVVRASTSPWRDRPYHQWYAAQVQGDPLPAAYAADFWNAQPTKPTVLYESPYENFWTDAAGERIRAYAAFLSGFYGFGYGVAGVWDDNYRDAPNADRGTAYDKTFRSWYDGMNRPSGHEMTYLRRFFARIPWWKLTPQFDLTRVGRFDDPATIRVAAEDHSTLVALFFGKGRATGTLTGLNPDTTYRARWYDPRTGTYATISDTARPDVSGTWNLPERPTATDYLLLVEAQPAAAIAR